jgi:hypothetical protein
MADICKDLIPWFKKMRCKLFVEFCFTVSIFCLLAGDLFLPQPYLSGSQQLKTNLNHFIVSLLPRKAIINFYTETGGFYC